MLVYRVQNAKGGGPYGASVAAERYTRIFPDNDRPTGDKDGLEGCLCLWDDTGWRFGFRDLEQARAWFDAPRRAALRRYGFELTAWEAPEVRYGTRQIAFRLDGARMVGHVAWEDWDT